MGERKKDALRVNFDRKLKLEFHGVKVTSDAGLLTFRELDEAFGFTAMINSKLTDNRVCRNTQHSLTALLRQSIYSRLSGYEDTEDQSDCSDTFQRSSRRVRKDSTNGSKTQSYINRRCMSRFGGKISEYKIGDCKYSDMSVFSFHPVKSITTAEGGAVLTNNKDFYKKLTMFRHHGVTKERDAFQNQADAVGGWYYEMQHLGYNYRLTDIHCALGISQLKKLDKFIQRRVEIVEKYNEAFKDNAFFDTPAEKDYAKSAWHLYQIRLKDKYKAQKLEVFSKLREKGLGVQVHYIPVHFQPYYQQLGYKRGAYSNAEDFHKRVISIPIYQTMSDEDVGCVISSLLDVFKHS